jgi:hypothetical protein
LSPNPLVNGKTGRDKLAGRAIHHKERAVFAKQMGRAKAKAPHKAALLRRNQE